MNQPVSILMISSSYPRKEKDWRSVFVRQMLTALSEKPGINMAYWGPPGVLPAGVNYVCIPEESAWLARLMEEGGLAHLLRNAVLRRFTASLQYLLLLRRGCKRQQQVDLYHVNWLQNALSLGKKRQPVLITVLGSDLEFLKIPGMTMTLRRVFKKRSCILAPNADWMVDKLNQKFGDLAKVISIPLGIENDWFNLQEKRDVCLPGQWLVVARVTSKKIGRLFDWGGELFSGNSDRELHLFGPMQEDMKIPDWVQYHGSTYPEELREKWFPGAMGLITISQHAEGRPQVMLEAMAAGLPILASNIEAHRNFISHGKTGWLVSSQGGFNSGIRYLSNMLNNREIAKAARLWVSKEVGTWSDCADRYLEVYRMLLGEKK